jgi:hypothetical protein
MVKTTSKPVNFFLSLIHPLLLGLYPLVMLVAENNAQIQLSDLWRSLIYSIIVPISLVLFCQLWVKDWKRSALMSSLNLVLFISFGHVYVLLQTNPIFLLYRADVLAATYAAIFIFGNWLIARRLRNLDHLNSFLNATMIIAILFPVVRILLFVVQNEPWVRQAPEELLAISPTISNNANYPNIYYIIVDGYARRDVLRDIYHYDNEEFLTFLEQKGFYIASSSTTNYPQTALSLASSLNFQYLDDLAQMLPPKSASRAPLSKSIHNNRLFSFLKSYGYQWVSYASGHPPSEIKNADMFLGVKARFNSVELSLLTGSAFSIVLNYQHSNDVTRERLLANLDLMLNPPEMQQPRFVFAHIILPHPPFVFDANGNPVSIGNFHDGNYFKGTREEYLSGYREQLIFLNQYLQQIITKILADSPTPPIIILQADHGPGAYLDWTDMQNTCLLERMSIINAYYLPGSAQADLYPEITPVNTFRLILDAYFDAELGLLPDRNYFSGWHTPYDFQDITNQVSTCYSR